MRFDSTSLFHLDVQHRSNLRLNSEHRWSSPRRKTSPFCGQTISKLFDEKYSSVTNEEVNIKQTKKKQSDNLRMTLNKLNVFRTGSTINWKGNRVTRRLSCSFERKGLQRNRHDLGACPKSPQLRVEVPEPSHGRKADRVC